VKEQPEGNRRVPQPARAESATSIAREQAVDRLVAAGCERQTLEGLFRLLVECKPLKLNSGITICLSPRDSLDDLFSPISKEKLPRMHKRVRNLLKDIGLLRRARLVRYLDDPHLAGCLRDAEMDLRLLADLLGNIPKRLKHFGARRRPDYTRRLTAIYKHIREHSGQWHDTHVATILNDLVPDSTAPMTAQALKEWRKRHGLTQ
jgi:hypothetical protein